MKKGITLIALIVTIIVLLILAGVSIALVLGDNGLLTKSTKAKKETVIEQAKEQIRIAIYAAKTDSKGEEITYSDLITELNNQFGIDGYSISDETEDEWVITVATSEGDVSESVSSNKMTIGKAYTTDWIGKMITYEANGMDKWVIIGQDENKNILITSLFDVGSFTTNHTLESWCDYENDLNNACRDYAGTIGHKNVPVLEARSITMDDIVSCLGVQIPESFDEYTFTSESGEKKLNLYYPDEVNKVWKQPTESNTWKHKKDCFDIHLYSYTPATNEITLGYSSSKINVMEIDAERPNYYSIFEDLNNYWIATRFMDVYQDREATFYVASGTYNGLGLDMGNKWVFAFAETNSSFHGDSGYETNEVYEGVDWETTQGLKPVVVLPANVLLEDVEIGDYFYNLDL